MTAETDEATGPRERVGDYVLGRTLGSGSTGAVFVASSVRYPGISYAIKRMSISCGANLSHCPEFSVMMRMRHPNLLRCFAVEKVESQLLIVMELCEGGSLFNELEQGPLSRDRFVVIARQLVEGVKYLHGQGVAHGGISLTNCLWKDSGRQFLALSDPELVTPRRFGWLPQRGLLGAFHAPEVWAAGVVDPLAADMWALGVVFAALVTGKVPWSGLTAEQMMEEMRALEYSVAPGAPDDIRSVIESLVCRAEGRAAIAAVAALPLFRRPKPIGLPLASSGRTLPSPTARAVLPRRRSGGSIGAVGVVGSSSPRPRSVACAGALNRAEG